MNVTRILSLVGITNIKTAGREELLSAKHALEDGECLAALGVQDEHQSIVEEAHFEVSFYFFNTFLKNVA